MTTLYSGKNFRLVRTRYASGSEGVEKTLDYVDQPEVVIAVPILEGGRIVLVEHVRPVLKTTLIECPGGKVDPGEDLSSCIIRELQEEIGYTPRHVDYVSFFFTSVGLSNEKIHVFIATDLVPHERNPEDVRRMQVRVLPSSQVWQMLRSDMFHDGKTEIALHKFFVRFESMKEITGQG